jgi:hypothetical protein
MHRVQAVRSIENDLIASANSNQQQKHWEWLHSAVVRPCSSPLLKVHEATSLPPHDICKAIREADYKIVRFEFNLSSLIIRISLPLQKPALNPPK